MATKIFGPRKRRTRQHVIADQSVHHVEGFILDEGHTALRVFYDYGYDLVMYTYDAQGMAEPGLISFQIKARENLTEIGGECVFDLDTRDYNLWINERMPVILILYDGSRRQAYWLVVKAYFQADDTRRPKRGAKTVRVRTMQVLTRRAIAEMRSLKKSAIESLREE